MGQGECHLEPTIGRGVLWASSQRLTLSIVHAAPQMTCKRQTIGPNQAERMAKEVDLAPLPPLAHFDAQLWRQEVNMYKLPGQLYLAFQIACQAIMPKCLFLSFRIQTSLIY